MAPPSTWPYCRRGHDKREVGTVGRRGACRLCHAERSRRIRRESGAPEREEGLVAPEGILRARRLLNLSAAEMARRMGCHASHYRSVEKRTKRTTPSFLKDILSVLHEEMRSRGLDKLPDTLSTPPRVQQDEFGKPRGVGRMPCRARALAVLRKNAKVWGEDAAEAEMSSADIASRIGCSRTAASMALKECYEAGFADRREAGEGSGNPLLYRAVSRGGRR